MEYLSNRKIHGYETTRANIEITMLSERSKSQKTLYFTISLYKKLKGKLREKKNHR